MELDKDTVFVLTRKDVIECAREMGIPLFWLKRAGSANARWQR